MWRIVAGNYDGGMQEFSFSTSTDASAWCDADDGGHRWNWVYMRVWFVRGNTTSGDQLELQFGEEQEAADWKDSHQTSEWQNVRIEQQPEQIAITTMAPLPF